jgi:hypothetical protein
MMFSSNVCRFALFSFLSLSANADTDTVRGVQRELTTVVELPVDLGTAGNYAILSKTGISTVPASVITGNIAVSPIAGEAMTGFEMAMGDDGAHSKDGTNQLLSSGSAYAANYGGVTPGLLTVAVLDMETAYTDAAGRPCADAARVNLGAGLLGGAQKGGATTPLTYGVYKFSTNVLITGDLFFEGTNTDIFIIQVAGNVIIDAGYSMVLKAAAAATDQNNKPLAKNIFWQVAGHVTVGAGAHLEGIFLVKTAATFITGSSLTGRVLAQTRCDLQKATITQPAL